MKNMVNIVNINGTLYDVSLDRGVLSDNRKYIRGTIQIQVDTDNVVTLNVFESETTASGNPNAKYATLERMMELGTTSSIVNAGADAAIAINVGNANLNLNDWYNQNGELVSSIQNFGGFIRTGSNGPAQATFEVDMLITSTADEVARNSEHEMEPTGNLLVKGYIFDFRKRIMPVTFVVSSAAGVEYFRSLENNTFTKVWGNIVTQTTQSTRVEKSSFGEDKVVTYTNTRKRYEIVGAASDVYEFGAEGILTVDEVKSALADREVHLAEVKNRSSRSNAASTPKTTSAPAKSAYSDFKF